MSVDDVSVGLPSSNKNTHSSVAINSAKGYGTPWQTNNKSFVWEAWTIEWDKCSGGLVCLENSDSVKWNHLAGTH